MNDNDYPEITDDSIGLRYALPGPYVTNLSSSDERQFQDWVKQNNVPFDPSPEADYDMRGFWAALMNGNPAAFRSINPKDKQIHYPDIWKTPYHKTFSNESIYSGDQAPHWEGNQLIDYFGRVIADETP